MASKRPRGDDRDDDEEAGPSSLKRPRSTSPSLFQCELCQAKFSRHFLLKQHKKSAHATPPAASTAISTAPPPSSPSNGRFKCDLCDKSFARSWLLSRHKLNVHHANKQLCVYDCPFAGCCYKGCKSWDYFIDHCKKMHPDKRWRCDNCGVQYTKDGFFSADHMESGHGCLVVRNRPPEAPLPQLPNEDAMRDFETDPFLPPPLSAPFWNDPLLSPHLHDDFLRQLLAHYWPYIRQRFDTDSPLVHNYSFRTTGNDVRDFRFDDALSFIYQSVHSPFTVNFGTTILLKNKRTGEEPTYKIHVAQNNRNFKLTKSLFVHDLNTLSRAKREIDESVDLEEIIERDDTSWQMVATLSVVFFVNIRPNHVAGKDGFRLPAFLSHDQNLISMVRNTHTNSPFTDSLCIFRIIVHQANEDYSDLAKVLAAYERYRTEVNGPPAKDFKGVPDNHLDLVENLFGLRFQIYRKNSKKDVVCLRKALSQDRPIVNIHSYPVNEIDVHYSFIKSLARFAGKNVCLKCNRIFRQKTNLTKHEKFNCNDGKPTFSFPGGTYENPPTIFQRMTEFGVCVERGRQICRLLTGFDMEAILEPVSLTFFRPAGDEANDERLKRQKIDVGYKEDASKIQKRERHVSVTGAIYTNVPGFPPNGVCFDDEDEETLIGKLHEAMEEISAEAYELEKTRFQPEFEKLQELRERAKQALDTTDSDKKKEKHILAKLDRLISDLDRYCKQHTIVGFNSGRYDLNLIKKVFYTRLVKKARQARDENAKGQGSFPTCITRGNQTLALTTDTLKLLDLSLFVAPGCNLAKYIACFTNGEEAKGKFCYEYARTRDDLLVTSLPPRDAFWSTLKRQGISEQDYIECQEIWDRMPVKNLLEFLKQYNLQDSKPMVNAALKMLDIYFDQFGLDCFKQAVSVPGLTMKFLFDQLAKEHPTVRFGLYDDDHGQQAQELFDSICGGLSTLNMRLIESGVTPVRPEEGSPKVQRIEAMDFNALYLHSMSYKPVPTGHPEHWRLKGEAFERNGDTEEERLKKRKSHGEVWFLRWLSWREHVKIITCEDRKQVRVGLNGYRADGWIPDHPDGPTAVFFNGCRYHRHDRNECLIKNVNFEGIDPSIGQKDEAMYKELRDLGIKVKIFFECSFRAIKSVAYHLRGTRRKPVPPDMLRHVDIEDAKAYNKYLIEHPTRKFKTLKQVTKKKMVDSLLDGTVFGFIKCSIRTPDHLKPQLEAYPPCIVNKEIAFDDLNDYMKQICLERGAMKKPRRCLIGCYSAQQVWLYSPLVQFYHKQRLEVYDVTEVIQYTPMVCFRFFGDRVTEKRMEGDLPGASSAISNSWKLFGNSGYGKCITRKERHRNVQFVDGIELAKIHESPFHDRSIRIADDCYESRCLKKQVKFDLPHVIGLATYANAKLRMLEFWYCVLLKYFDMSKINLAATDTDSFILSLAGETLFDCVKPELKEEFERDVCHQWFVMDDTQKRIPGLLKQEFAASHMCCLAPKAYASYDERNLQAKPIAKAKGCQCRNCDILHFQNYKDILEYRPEANCIIFNMSIRNFPDGVFSTISEKSGLTPVFVKRHVLPSGHTTVMDI